MHQENLIFISVGANQGNPVKQIRETLNLIEKHPRFTDTVISPLYKTSPVDYLSQPDFINGIITAKTTHSPIEVFQSLKHIESLIGTGKTFEKGPRYIDLDLIFFSQHVLTEPDLVIPHPSMEKRLFVLAPLCDLHPHFQHPVLKTSCHDLLIQCKMDYPEQKIEKI